MTAPQVSDYPGIVYAVENKAWPGWVKIGRAEGTKPDAEGTMRRRLYSYNTGDPHQSYAVIGTDYASCCRTAERFAFNFFEIHFESGFGEWFQADGPLVHDFIQRACAVARLAPASRADQFKRHLEEVRAMKDDTERFLQEIADIETKRERSPDVGETARAASEVIRILLDYMAMPDERTQAAAEVVLRRLDALGAE